jgi:hypothetical protein
MEHSEWLPWIAKNCPLAQRKARDELRKTVFSFAHNMGKTLIDIEAKLDELLTEQAEKGGTT